MILILDDVVDVVIDGDDVAAAIDSLDCASLEFDAVADKDDDDDELDEWILFSKAVCCWLLLEDWPQFNAVEVTIKGGWVVVDVVVIGDPNDELGNDPSNEFGGEDLWLEVGDARNAWFAVIGEALELDLVIDWCTWWFLLVLLAMVDCCWLLPAPLSDATAAAAAAAAAMFPLNPTNGCPPGRPGKGPNGPGKGRVESLIFSISASFNLCVNEKLREKN